MRNLRRTGDTPSVTRNLGQLGVKARAVRGTDQLGSQPTTRPAAETYRTTAYRDTHYPSQRRQATNLAADAAFGIARTGMELASGGDANRDLTARSEDAIQGSARFGGHAAVDRLRSPANRPGRFGLGPRQLDPITGQPVRFDPATGQPLKLDPITGQPVRFDPATGRTLSGGQFSELAAVADTEDAAHLSDGPLPSSRAGRRRAASRARRRRAAKRGRSLAPAASNPTTATNPTNPTSSVAVAPAEGRVRSALGRKAVARGGLVAGARDRAATRAAAAKLAAKKKRQEVAKRGVRATSQPLTRLGNLGGNALRAVSERAAAALAGVLSSTPTVVIVAVVLVVVATLIAVLSVIPSIGQQIEEQEKGAMTCGNGALDIPPAAKPWMERAAQSSGLPVGYLAAMAMIESSFDPKNFTMDSNGGTWGLFQINRSEWHRFYPEGDNPGGTPHGITDPMIHAEVGGRYLKDRLENVKRMQAKNPDTEWGKLPELDALTIAHNAGEGNLVKYPNIPSITKAYLEKQHMWFQAGPCPTGQGAPGEIRPPAGKLVSPIPAGTTGVQMTAKYGRYPSGGPHWGVDLAKGGDGAWTIHNVCDGTVKAIKINPNVPNSTAGPGTTNYIWIDCGNNVLMGYGHFYARDLNGSLKEGMKIGAGTPLFPQGNQGNSHGSHLHFQISTTGSMAYGSSSTVDPSTYLAGLGVQLPKPNY